MAEGPARSVDFLATVKLPRLGVAQTECLDARQAPNHQNLTTLASKGVERMGDPPIPKMGCIGVQSERIVPNVQDRGIQQALLQVLVRPLS